MKQAKKMSKIDAIFLLIAGLIMGTVFTFGMQYWNTPVTYDDAQHVTATFSSYEESKNSGHIKQIIVRFDDYEQLCIDGTCIDTELCEAVSNIMPGTVIDMVVHPNSNTILEMKINQQKLLTFENTVQNLSNEATEFMYLGIICYMCALLGLFHLLSAKKLNSPFF